MRLDYLSLVVTFVIFIVFPALLVMMKGGNAGFYVLLICVLIRLFTKAKNKVSLGRLLTKYWYLHLGMGAILLAMLISDLSTLTLSIKAYDGPSRLAVFPLILWLLLSLSPGQLRAAEWGYLFGAISGAILIFFVSNGGESRENINGAPIIVFSNIALLLGTLSVLSLYAKEGSTRLESLLKVIAGGAGIYASYLSQARGSWLCIPFLALFSICVLQPNRKRATAAIAAFLVIAGAVLILSNPMVKARIHSAQVDIVKYRSGADIDTSLGIRFQLWNGSWLTFKEHPVFGVGPANFKRALKDLEQRKVITPMAAGNFYHSHNDTLFNMATLGLFGLLAILATYICPAVFCFRHLRSTDRRVKVRACMGLSIISGYVIFGLTDCFFWGLSYTFYSVVLAIICAQLISLTALGEIARTGKEELSSTS